MGLEMEFGVAVSSETSKPGVPAYGRLHLAVDGAPMSKPGTGLLMAEHDSIRQGSLTSRSVGMFLGNPVDGAERDLAEARAISTVWAWYVRSRDRFDLPFATIVLKVREQCSHATVERIQAEFARRHRRALQLGRWGGGARRHVATSAQRRGLSPGRA